MDRYIVREPRMGAVGGGGGGDYPQNTGMLTFVASSNPVGNKNITMPPNMYNGYEIPMQRVMGANTSYVMAPINHRGPNFIPNQNQMMSGIDPRYLAAYGNNMNSTFIAGPRNQIQADNMNISPAPETIPSSDYHNRSFLGNGSENNATYQFQQYSGEKQMARELQRVMEKAEEISQPKTNNNVYQPQTKHEPNTDVVKNEVKSTAMTKMDKLKELHKSGPRIFSGPIEKVLKWHKSLQDIGIMAIYEIVAKCVSIRAGESCAKNLVVRDENGPAIQVVYYEIDFLLPDIRPPCIIRVVGRMQPGSSRLHAFSVRAAAAGDAAAQPRRAAAANAHVTKLCSDFASTR